MSYYHSANLRELLASIAEIVCPPTPSARSVEGEILQGTQQAMRAFPMPARAALLSGLASYDAAARLYPAARGKPARKLRGEIAERYFASWWRSSIGLQREFVRGLKGLISLSYYETEAVKQHLDYTPEAWIEKVKRHRLSVYQDAIERQRVVIVEPDPLPPWSSEETS